MAVDSTFQTHFQPPSGGFFVGKIHKPTYAQPVPKPENSK
jgi:hypothetical protein